MPMDMIVDGRGYGEVASALVANGGHQNFDPGLMRPYLDARARRCVTINTRRMSDDNKPIYRKIMTGNRGDFVTNATTLRKNEWILLDQAVIHEARKRLRAWSDLSAAASYGGFNGYGKMILEHEMMSDPGEALVDMDGVADDRDDAPQFQLQGLPLPVTHCGFSFSKRRLDVSRNSGTPLDMTLPEAAARRVAESVEKTLVGVQTGLTYGASTLYESTSKVYGYTNFPQRLTKTNLATPTGSNAATTVANVLAMRDQLTAQNFFGPFMLYHSNDWDQYMDNDYILTGGNVATQTLRERLQSIEGIQDVRRLDFLSAATNPFTLIMVQMTSDVARAVNGMDITTIQWETKGGLMLHFKVMCIMVPQLRHDFSDRCGILHATTS